MRYVDRANQVDFQHVIPVGRLELPERESEFAGTDANREDDMIFNGIQELGLPGLATVTGRVTIDQKYTGREQTHGPDHSRQVGHRY